MVKGLKLFALLKSLREELLDGLLLEAAGAANTGVASMIDHSLRRLGHPAKVPLLVFFLLLLHLNGQLDVPFIALLTSGKKSVHFLFLAFVFETFRICRKINHNDQRLF